MKLVDYHKREYQGEVVETFYYKDPTFHNSFRKNIVVYDGIKTDKRVQLNYADDCDKAKDLLNELAEVLEGFVGDPILSVSSSSWSTGTKVVGYTLLDAEQKQLVDDLRSQLPSLQGRLDEKQAKLKEIEDEIYRLQKQRQELND